MSFSLDLPVISDEMMRAAQTSTREYTVVVLHKAAAYADKPEVQAVIWEHGRRNHALRAAGVLSIVCPVRDGSDVSGVSIFNGDVAHVREIMDGDPGVQAGIFNYELHPCRSFPGDSLPARASG